MHGARVVYEEQAATRVMDQIDRTGDEDTPITSLSLLPGVQMGTSSANAIRTRRFHHLRNRPDIRLQRYLLLPTRKSPCDPDAPI